MQTAQQSFAMVFAPHRSEPLFGSIVMSNAQHLKIQFSDAAPASLVTRDQPPLQVVFSSSEGFCSVEVAPVNVDGHSINMKMVGPVRRVRQRLSDRHDCSLAIA